MLPVKYLIGHTKKEGHNVYIYIGYDSLGNAFDCYVFTDQYPYRLFLADWTNKPTALSYCRKNYCFEADNSFFLNDEQRKEFNRAVLFPTPQAAMQAVIKSKLIKRLPMAGRSAFRDVPKSKKH